MNACRDDSTIMPGYTAAILPIRHKRVNIPAALQAGNCGVATATLQFFFLNQLCVAGILLNRNSRKHAKAKGHRIKTFFT